MLRRLIGASSAFDRVPVLQENTLVMKYAKRPTLPRGLRWDSRSPHICFSWRDERGRQHQQSTNTSDPAEALAFKQHFQQEKRDAVDVRRVRAADQSRLPLGTAAKMYFDWKAATNSPGTIAREKRMFKQVENFIGSSVQLRRIDVEHLREYQQERHVGQVLCESGSGKQVHATVREPAALRNPG